MLLLPQISKTSEDEYHELGKFIMKAYEVVKPIALDLGHQNRSITSLLDYTPEVEITFNLTEEYLNHPFYSCVSDGKYNIKVAVSVLIMKHDSYYRKVLTIEFLIHELIHFRLDSPYIRWIYSKNDPIGKYHRVAIEEIVNIETFRLITENNDYLADILGIDMLKNIKFDENTKMIYHTRPPKGWVYNIIGDWYWLGHHLNNCVDTEN